MTLGPRRAKAVFVLLVSTFAVRLCIELCALVSQRTSHGVRAGSLRVEEAPLAFAAPTQVATPTSEELMQSLGRELWLASDELLSMSALLPGGSPVANMAISMRNAADLMLEGQWEDVMAELENAQVSAESIVSAQSFQGLVNLFSYDQPVPKLEWMNARASLWYIAGQLEKQCTPMINSEDQQRNLEFATETLKQAMLLFEPGNFYMAEDPRDKNARAGRGHKRTWEARESARRPETSSGPTAQQVEMWRLRLKEEILATAGAEAYAAASAKLTEIDQQLESAGESGKSRVLRQMLRDLHPDQNPGKEAEVTPVFQYVQKLRASLK